LYHKILSIFKFAKKESKPKIKIAKVIKKPDLKQKKQIKVIPKKSIKLPKIQPSKAPTKATSKDFLLNKIKKQQLKYQK
jgi:hypothetical protein